MMQNFKISRDEAYDFLNTMFESEVWIKSSK